jgi:hypothetical protein
MPKYVLVCERSAASFRKHRGSPRRLLSMAVIKVHIHCRRLRLCHTQSSILVATASTVVPAVPRRGDGPLGATGELRWQCCHVRINDESWPKPDSGGGARVPLPSGLEAVCQLTVGAGRVRV